MFRSLICGASAALFLSLSMNIAHAQEEHTYRAVFDNKQYSTLNGVARKEIYANEPMVNIVDARIEQTDSGARYPGKFKVGSSNFNPRGSSIEAETTADAEKPVRLVTFIAIGTGFGNKYQGEIFKRATAIDPAGAPVDGVKPQWMIGGLNEGPRRNGESIPDDQVLNRLFGEPTEAEAAKAAENRALIEQALRDQLAASTNEAAKKLGEARLGDDEAVKRFFAAPPAGLDLSAFADVKDAARLRKALDLIAVQILGGGKTDAEIMGLLAASVKKLPAAREPAVEPAPPTAKPVVKPENAGTAVDPVRTEPSKTEGVAPTLNKAGGPR